MFSPYSFENSSELIKDDAISLSVSTPKLKLLIQYFNPSTFDKLITTDSDVIGFVKVNNDIGNLSRNFNKLSPWYGLDSSTSLSTLFSNTNKGSILINSSDSWGPVINTSPKSLTVFIVIGLNNSEEL